MAYYRQFDWAEVKGWDITLLEKKCCYLTNYFVPQYGLTAEAVAAVYGHKEVYKLLCKQTGRPAVPLDTRVTQVKTPCHSLYTSTYHVQTKPIPFRSKSESAEC